MASTSNVLLMDAKGALAVMEAAIAARDLSTSLEGEDYLGTASAVNKLVLSGFSLAEKGAYLAGADNSTLRDLKSYELFPRAAELPLQIMKCAANPSGDPLADFQKAIIAPTAGMMETALDGAIYYEKHFIAMSPEEREKAQRPIYILVGDEWKCVGHKPVDIAECQANLAMYEKESLIAGTIKFCAEMEVFGSLYERLALFLQNYHNQVPLIQNQEAEADPQQGFNLMALPMIPEFLHEDETFKLFICPITHLPIRRPVGDPTNGITVYEYSAIVSWLAVNPRSPITQMPLTPDRLVERPAIQAIINSRLQQHQDRLLEYIESSPAFQQQLGAPAPVALSQAVEQENEQVHI